MKTIILFAVILMAYVTVMADKWVPAGSADPVAAEIELISSSIETSTIRIVLKGFYQNEVLTPRGEAAIIHVGESTPILETGSPDLGKLTTSLIIPDRAHMELEVVSSQFREFTGIAVAPSKGNFTRDIDPSTVPYIYGTAYQTDGFYPGKLADLREPYILRDYRGQTVIFFPFQYNPVTNTLRVYTEMTIIIRPAGESGINPLYRDRELATVDRDFNKIYQQHFLNANSSRYTPLEEEGNMLIISYGDFMDEMQPFIDWKTLMGRPVEMVDVAEIGNSAAIKSYVADYYNTTGLTYLLLVGDAPQVPTSYASGDSDNDYGYIVGNDHYPDVFVGRFSAENTDQVVTQVTRSVDYEKFPEVDPDWYTRNMGIASSQGPGDDNEMDYQHVRNMQTDLMNYTYDYNAELFDGSQGGNDAPGNPNPSMVADEINTGVSVILYTGHGSTTSWSTSGFSNNDINNLLTNTGKLPFIWSVACVNGNFKNSFCFAEAWMRATHNGEPKGAISTLMSTINQSWDPPMEGQDEMVDILVESYTNNIKRSFAGISMNGCMKMNDSYGSGGWEMTDTWTVFGDPSIVVRTAPPATMNVTYQNPLPLGSTQLYVSTNANEGLVCLSFNDAIVATAYIASNGAATLTFPPISGLQPRKLTVTSYNKKPFLGTLEISGEPAPACSPYPANGSPAALPFTDLKWSKGNGGIPDYFKVYFGTDNPPSNIVNGTSVEDTLFIPPQELDFETQYLWQIKSFNQYGDAISPVWSFTVESPPDEDFENGSFLGSDWYTGGNVPWIVDDNTARHGNYSARSGNVSEGMTSSLLIDRQCESMFMVPISFYFKVSSREGLNFLQFLVDGVLMGEWSGEIDWTKAVFNVASGLHTYEWRYVKTAPAETDLDHAWIDYINFPQEFIPVIVNAGDDGVVCESEGFTLNGSAMHYQTLMWTTSGDGQFDDPTLLQPVYTAGMQDIENGQAVLTLTAYRDEHSSSDEMILTVQHAPYAYAGESGETCEGSDYLCEQAEESYCTSLLWTTSGDGSFDDATILHPLYTPGPADIAAGSVILTLAATGIEPCGEASHSMPLTIDPLPETPPIPEGPTYVDLHYTPSSSYTTSGSAWSVSYSWKMEPAFAGNVDSDGMQCVITWNPEFLGNATIQVKGMNDCGESDYSEGLIVMVDNTVGFNDRDVSPEILIQPNPSDGIFALEIDLPGEDIINIRILDATGHALFEQSDVQVNGTFRQIIRINDPGLYILSVEGTSLRSIRKIMIH